MYVRYAVCRAIPSGCLKLLPTEAQGVHLQIHATTYLTLSHLTNTKILPRRGLKGTFQLTACFHDLLQHQAQLPAVEHTTEALRTPVQGHQITGLQHLLQKAEVWE